MDQKILSAVFNSIREGILTTNNHGKILFCSKSSERILHASPQGLMNKNIFDVLNIPESEEVHQNFQLLNKNKIASYNFLATTGSSGNSKSLHVELKALADKNDWQALFILTPKVEDEHTHFDQQAEYSCDFQIIFAEDKAVFVSPSINEVLGYDEDEIDSAQAWSELIYEDDIDSHRNQLEIDRKLKTPFSLLQYRIRHKDGNYRLLDTRIRREFRKNGQMIETATFVDISFQKNTRLQCAFIEQVFDASPNLIFVRDSSGKLIYCNQAVSDLVGKSREELLSQEKNMFPASDQQDSSYQEIDQLVINSGQEILFEEQIPDSQGIPNYYQTVKKPFRTPGGEVQVLNISTNINRIKIKEKEIRNVLKIRNDFFSAMSHEIRTPMNAILGMTELMMRRRPRQDQIKLLKTLHFSSNNLLSLINDILDFSKIEAGKIEIEHVNFNIYELLENVMESQRTRVEEKNTRLEFKIANDVPEIINGDYIKLSQILNNLLSNAIKFTPKGKITIDIELLATTESGYNLGFAVADTGIGIAEDMLKNIFDPFHQAKKSTTREYGGTGLGLSIVKNLVEIQKGSIRVESEEHVGTVFRVTLPFDKADQALPINSLSHSEVPEFESKINLSVLYVEDVTTNQFLIEEILGEWGIGVEMAEDGFKALEMISDKKFDLILMDIQMPGIDGLETTRRIRAMKDPFFKEIPIIALTASTSDSTKEEIIKCGMQDYILKPVKVNDLREKIVRYSDNADALGEFSRKEYAAATEKDEDTMIIFDQTDALFQGNFVRYQLFLKMTIDEFKVNLELLKATIWDDDLTAYRKLRHRMRSMLSTFGMNELLKLMDQIRDSMFGGELAKKEKKEYTEALQQHVTILIDNLTNKLASLKWE